MEKKSIFQTLNAINCNEHTEKKNGLTYLTWSWAWAEVKSRYPDATHTVVHWDGKPFLYDPDLGYMVETSVTISGETLTMWLPVMDGKNKAMKDKPYNYQVWNYAKREFEEKKVEAATMFDINTAIMRCLVKNLALFGLGLYIYAGEDLPEDATPAPVPAPKPAPKAAPKPAMKVETDDHIALQVMEQAKQPASDTLPWENEPKVDGKPVEYQAILIQAKAATSVQQLTDLCIKAKSMNVWDDEMKKLFGELKAKLQQ